MARATKKYKFTCLNGPYKGKVLLLSTATTLLFTLGKDKGRYVSGRQHRRAVGSHPLDYAFLSTQDFNDPLFVKCNPMAGTELVWEEH
ncbi:MAG: hypothetical protein JKY62_16905 [Desulfocapsa sp.]|nr:hypothetical protein [Desulfocapsa sp.]